MAIVATRDRRSRWRGSAGKHFAEEEAFVRLAREAKPSWLFAALLLQAATYLAQGEIWRLIGRIAGCRLPLPFVYKLALGKLFIDQALSSAGVSGTVVVAQVLERTALRRKAVLAGLVVNSTSFFIAYVGALTVALVTCFHFGHADSMVVVGSVVFMMLSAVLTAGMLELSGKELKQRALVAPPLSHRSKRAEDHEGCGSPAGA